MVDIRHIPFANPVNLVSRLLITLLLAAIVSPSTPTATAQDAVEGVFLAAPRELEQRIRRAEKAIAENQFGEAVMFLGGVLDGSANESGEAIEDYFVTLQGNTKTSLKSRAEQLIGSMPKEARDLYEVQYGAEAKRLLDAALESGNASSLSKVSGRYFHTEAGYESTMLLGRHYLRRGRPVAAAISFRRIVSSESAAAKFEPVASLMLATSWRAADRNDLAREALEQLRARTSNAEFDINGQNVAIFGEGEDALAWHEKVVGQLQLGGSAVTDNWALHRGNAARNATSSGTMPMAELEWEVELVLDSKIDEPFIQRRVESYRKTGTPAIPTLHPLVVGEWVLYRTPDWLFGVSLKTGKRIWAYPWDNSLEFLGKDPDESSTPVAELRHRQLKQRIWEDSPYGQMSSNGKAVYLLDELGYSLQGNGRIVIQRGRPGTNPNMQKPYNALVALDIEKEGKMMWRVGGLQGEDEPKLAGAFFMGPPLPIASELYVIAEMKGETKLVVLDAATGALQWSQQLTHLENNSILRDGIRRMAGATPSFADGVLVCPTSIGAAVAVDVANRSLMWGYAYGRTNQITSNQGRVFVGGRMVKNYPNPEIGKRWVDATATIGGGSVVLTPIESTEMHCLDVITGKKRWTKSRSDWLYVAAIHDDGVVVVGKRAVAKFDLERGDEVWRVKLPEKSAPSGIGFVSADDYFLAVAGPSPALSQILKIDMKLGKILAQEEAKEVLGNLIPYRDKILSLSPLMLSCYYQSERLEKTVARKLEENPNDARYLEHQAKLLAKKGRHDEAVDALRRAVEIYEQEDSDLALVTREDLAKMLLDALRTSDELDMDVVAELRSLIQDPDQNVEFQRLLAMAFHRSKQYDEAFDAYMRIAEGFIASRMSLTNPSAAGELTLIEESRKVRQDRWLRRMIAAVLRESGNKDRIVAELDHRVNQMLTSDATTASMRRFVSVFGDCDRIDLVKLRFAQMCIEDGDIVEAELVLMGLLESDVAADALISLASMYKDKKKPQAAERCYQELVNRFPEYQPESGPNAEQLLSQYRRTYPSKKWPMGKLESTASSPAQMQRFPSELHMPLIAKRGFGAAGTSYWVNRSSGSQRIITSRDHFGQPTWSTTVGSARSNQAYRFANAHVMGHLVICSVGYNIVALDAFAGMEQEKRELWNTTVRDLSDEQATGYSTLNSTSQPSAWGITVRKQFDGNDYRLGKVACLSPDGVCIHVQDELRCLDPATGDIVWSRSDIPSDAEIWGDDQYVLVRSRRSTKATVYFLQDGERNVSSDGEKPLLRDVPESSRWLTTYGRHILTWSTQVNGANPDWRLRLFDPVTQRDVWHRDFKVKSRADLMVDTNELTVLEPDGKVTVLRIADGEPNMIGRVSLETRGAEPLSVNSIRSFSFEDKVLLICRRTPRAILEGVARPATRMLESSTISDAEIHALQRGTGKVAWDDPVKVQQFELPLLQAPGLPIWFFGRSLTHRTNPRGQLTIMGIDKRTGRQVFFEDKLFPKKENMQIVGNAQQNTIVAQLPDDKVYRLKLTDQPLPQPDSDDSGANGLEKGEIPTISDFVEDFFGDSDESKKRVPLAEDPFAPE